MGQGRQRARTIRFSWGGALSFARGLALLGGVFLSSSSSGAQGNKLPKLMATVASCPQPGELLSGYEAFPLVPSQRFASTVLTPEQGAFRFLSVDGKLLAGGLKLPRAGVRILPVEPGYSALRLKTGLHRIAALDIRLKRKGVKAPSRVALSRALPRELMVGGQARLDEDESFAFEVRGPAEALPSVVELISEGQEGRYADALRDLPLLSAPCPEDSAEEQGPSLACATTPSLRLAVDTVDRNHPATAGRSLLGEVGGQLELRVGQDASRAFPVGAPEALEKGGPGRYLVKVKAKILRTFAGGPASVGADDEEAVRIVRSELDAASRMWGQCGVTLGPQSDLSIEVVDPPEITLLTVGCEAGLLATGGDVALQVLGRQVRFRTLAGQSPAAVASRLAGALRDKGAKVRVFRNAVAENSALPSFDLLVTDSSGKPAAVKPLQGHRLSLDPTLRICHSELELADGLDHFRDANAASGTREERILLRALSDDDPSSIELIVVPVFGGMGRIGESFIYTPGASLQNALILDRTGIRAGARSYTLAHELGHILLELPGHPDDFGVDTPTSLMDADAADATIFGPRRLSLADCRRALQQSGRGAPVPLIFDWPLGAEAPLSQ